MRARKMCQIAGCGKPHVAKELCGKHYQQARAYPGYKAKRQPVSPGTTPVARFLALPVVRADG